jgi:hypothetical protein
MTTRSINNSHIFRVYSTRVLIKFTLASQHPRSLQTYQFFFIVMSSNLLLFIKVVLELPLLQTARQRFLSRFEMLLTEDRVQIRVEMENTRSLGRI